MAEAAPYHQSAEDWSARQYLKFEDERTRPPRDVLAQRAGEFHRTAGRAVSCMTRPVWEWFKSSSLRPYCAPLDGAPRVQFLATYTDAVAHAYPARNDGKVDAEVSRPFHRRGALTSDFGRLREGIAGAGRRLLVELDQVCDLT